MLFLANNCWKFMTGNDRHGRYKEYSFLGNLWQWRMMMLEQVKASWRIDLFQFDSIQSNLNIVIDKINRIGILSFDKIRKWMVSFHLTETKWGRGVWLTDWSPGVTQAVRSSNLQLLSLYCHTKQAPSPANVTTFTLLELMPYFFHSLIHLYY